jgi:protoporphyrinogen/coproporphyrinogen III oxidase
MPTSIPVAIIGGGICGLACAYRLRQLGIPAILFESSEQVGGLIGSVEKDGFLFESGPQSFHGTETLLNLIKELGLEQELQTADPKAPRYVLRRGRLEKVPMSPQAILGSSLISVSSRLRIVSEPLRRTRPPGSDESVADFVRRKFGHEILEYLVSPFVSGVYAGDPELLSLKAAFPTLEEWERQYGSVIRGAMKSRPEKGARKGPPPLCSFRGGMRKLTDAIANKLGEQFQSGARVRSVKRANRASDGAQYEIRAVCGGQEETIAARAVVVATPAYVGSHLLSEVSAALAKSLSSIAYAPVAVVAAGYHTHQTEHPMNGFGFLVPRAEKLRTLGTIWNSSLFPGRAPAGMIAITSFIGGATDTEICEKPEAEIAAIVHAENAKILGIAGPPVATAVWKHPKALPQYNLGHGHTVEAIRKAERETPGLFFSGNYLEGPSLGKCIEQAFTAAEAVCANLKERP